MYRNGHPNLIPVCAAVLVAFMACSDSSGPGIALDVAITAPADGDRFLDTSAVDFAAQTGTGADSLVWRSSHDGRLGKGASITVDGLSVGSHAVTVVAFASGGRDSVTISIEIETLPDVSILQPATESAFPPGEIVQLEGEAVDRDGGTATLRWRSSLDGNLGSGAVFQAEGLSRGVHVVWLIASDDEGQSDSASVRITIQDYALRFDGIDDGASASGHADLDLTGTWTIELWVHPYDASAGHQHLVSKWGPSIDSQSYMLAIDNEEGFSQRGLRVGTSNGDRGNATVSVDIFRDSVWQHIAAVFDQGHLQVLYNGVVIDPGSGFAVPQPTDAPLSLGRRLHVDGAASEHFVGLLDEVRLWNVARTPDQIRQVRFARLSGSEVGLVAYWRMEEGEGDAVRDATGRGHALRLGDAGGPDAADPAWHLPGQDVR